MSYNDPTPVREILSRVLKTVSRAWADCAEAVDSMGREAYADYTTPVKYSLCGAIIAHSSTYRDYEVVRDTFKGRFGVDIHTFNKRGQQAVVDAVQQLIEAV